MTRIRTHPGEVLREDFMLPLGLSANARARSECPTESDYADHRHTKATSRYPGYGTQAGALFRHNARTLAEPADEPRSEGRGRAHPKITEWVQGATSRLPLDFAFRDRAVIPGRPRRVRGTNRCSGEIAHL